MYPTTLLIVLLFLRFIKTFALHWMLLLSCSNDISTIFLYSCYCIVPLKQHNSEVRKINVHETTLDVIRYDMDVFLLRRGINRKRITISIKQQTVKCLNEKLLALAPYRIQEMFSYQWKE